MRRRVILSLLAFGATAPGTLRAQPTLRVGMASAWPMMMPGKDGKPTGFAADMLTEAAHRQGVVLAWVAFPPKVTVDEALQRKDIDLIPTGIASQERRRRFFVSEPWWSSEIAAVVPASSPVRNGAGLAGLRLATPAAVLLQLSPQYSSSTLIRQPNARAATVAVCTGEADAALFASMYLGELLTMHTNPCRDFPLRIVATGTPIRYSFISRRESSKTAAALRQRIDEMLLDGTLTSYAGRYPLLSASSTEHAAELIRSRYQIQLMRFAGAALIVLLTVGMVLFYRLHRSRAQVRAAHSKLEADMAERHALERQLLHSQKMESVGMLAGGVAHDFNNLLTVIIGYTNVLQNQLANNDAALGHMEQIAKASAKAAALTRQLLLFSRQQMTVVEPVAINATLADIQKMLRRLIGEDIEISLTLDAGSDVVKADPGHLGQLVVNLAVNARDAMPNGGRLAMRTSNIDVDQAFARMHPGLTPGPHIVITVADTGSGMTPEVLQHIFEPFYTTKEPDKGTGLGLSTVYGIVKQCGGIINVYSEPGSGTTFKIILPLAAPSDGAQQTPTTAVYDYQGKETVLLVEDDAAVRQYIRDVLAGAGYNVIETRNGRDALEAAGAHIGVIGMMLTDLVMPEMGGIELAKRFANQRPGTPVLHMSGYSDQIRDRSEAILFIEKPFTPSALLTRVREILDANPTSPPAP